MHIIEKMRVKAHLSVMRPKLRMIRLYSLIQECYDSQLYWHCQRFSANKREPVFTDIELLTCYFFCIIEEQRFIKKEMHSHIYKYWSDYFPDLPSYQAFNDRLNRLSPVFAHLFSLLSERLCCFVSGSQRQPVTLLTDSMPIIVSSGNRTNKIAPGLADKSYCSSKRIYYHGLKLHLIAVSNPNKLPLPLYLTTTPASDHDLTPLKPLLTKFQNCRLFGDKAYESKPIREELEKQQSELLTPEKAVKGEGQWHREFAAAYRKQLQKAVSTVRQPIESFFHWIIEKTGIQNASKVRSLKGLNVHIYARAAAALMIMLDF